MSITSVYTLSSRISRDYSVTTITRGDGVSVPLTDEEVGSLLLDLAVDGLDKVGRRPHHHHVLGQWFDQKLALSKRATLKVVV